MFCLNQLVINNLAKIIHTPKFIGCDCVFRFTVNEVLHPEDFALWNFYNLTPYQITLLFCSISQTTKDYRLDDCNRYSYQPTYRDSYCYLLFQAIREFCIRILPNGDNRRNEHNRNTTFYLYLLVLRTRYIPSVSSLPPRITKPYCMSLQSKA